jgi:hypothetical protein
VTVGEGGVTFLTRRAFLRRGGGLSLESLGMVFGEVPEELAPLLGIVAGTNGGAPGRGATVVVGVVSGGDVGETAVAGAVGAAEGLKALGVLSFPQAVAIKPSATNKAILE